MLPSNFELLRHIHDEISFVLNAVANKDKESVINDPVLSRAIIRSLEIIGEASNKLDADFKSEHPEIEWRKIVNTRHRLIHDYFGVDYDIVWDIITNKLPDLHDFVGQIISAE
jgi:uncharacterized protein with HEPN domain